MTLLRVTVKCDGCGERLSSDQRFVTHSVFNYEWVCIKCKVLCDELVANSVISRGNVR